MAIFPQVPTMYVSRSYGCVLYINSATRYIRYIYISAYISHTLDVVDLINSLRACRLIEKLSAFSFAQLYY